MNNIVNKLGFGGLLNLDEESINVRMHQIRDGYRLHSCFHYGKSLDVIKIASNRVGIIPKISTKVYYNFHGEASYQGIHNNIYNQLELIVERLGFIPKSWHIQLCNITDIRPFTILEFIEFKKKVKSNFGRVHFFVESFIFSEEKIKKIILNNYVDGITFRDSAFDSQASQEMRDYLIKNEINFSSYHGLSGVSNGVGKDSKILSILLNDTKIKTPLDLNLSFIKSQIGVPSFNYSVLSVSTIEHYQDLIKRLTDIDVLSQEQAKLVEELKQESYSILAWSDDYGAAKKPTLSFIYMKHIIRKLINRIKDLFNGRSWL